jgi:hypothetical protein
MLLEIRCQHKLANQIRIRPVSENRVSNHLETMLDPGRLVDIDVSGQSARLAVPHESHLQIGMRVATLETTFGKLEALQRFVKRRRRRLVDGAVAKPLRQCGIHYREKTILPAEKQRADEWQTVVRRWMRRLSGDIQQTRFS